MDIISLRWYVVKDVDMNGRMESIDSRRPPTYLYFLSPAELFLGLVEDHGATSPFLEKAATAGN